MFAPPRNGPIRKPPPYRGARLTASQGDLRTFIRDAVQECVKEMLVKDGSGNASKAAEPNPISVKTAFVSNQVRYHNSAVRQRSLHSQDGATAGAAAPAASFGRSATAQGLPARPSTEPNTARKCPSANAIVAQQCEAMHSHEHPSGPPNAPPVDESRQWMHWRSSTPFTQKSRDLKEFRHWQNPHKPSPAPTPTMLSRSQSMHVVSRPGSSQGPKMAWQAAPPPHHSHHHHPQPHQIAPTQGPQGNHSSQEQQAHHFDVEHKHFQLKYMETPDGTSQLQIQSRAPFQHHVVATPPKASTFDPRRSLRVRPMSADSVVANRQRQMPGGHPGLAGSNQDIQLMKNWIDRARESDRLVLQQVMKVLGTSQQAAVPTGMEGLNSIDSNAQRYVAPQEYFSRMIPPMTPLQQYFPTHQYHHQQKNGIPVPTKLCHSKPPVNASQRVNIMRVKHQEVQTTPRNNVAQQTSASVPLWQTGRFSPNVVQTCPQRLRNMFT